MSKGKMLKLTNHEVLEILRGDAYTIDLTTGVITSNRTKKPIYTYTDKKHNGAERNGYLWCRIFGNGMYRAISVSNVVWMKGADKVIPSGFEIHHRNRDKQDNRWSNLFCLYSLDHAKLHNPPDTDLLTDDTPF